MKIDFNNLEEKSIVNFHNGKKSVIARMYLDSQNKIMHGKLEPGASIGMHKHVTSSEIIYIISGIGTVLCCDKTEVIHSGECHYCPKGNSHSLINNSDNDLVFFAVVPEQ